MKITVDSDLNGASPQFTLTCISTGGPATTVTWTRDSTTVTEGARTVLVNETTAEYVHSLTGKQAGNYACIIANNKPSTSSASLSVEGITPHCKCLRWFILFIVQLLVLHLI